MFKPLNNFVLVEFDNTDTERKTAGGIVMPGTAGSNFMHATVVATSSAVEIEGTNHTRRPRVLKGDRVVVMVTAPPALPGLEVEPGSPVRVIQENEIIGTCDA